MAQMRGHNYRLHIEGEEEDMEQEKSSSSHRTEIVVLCVATVLVWMVLTLPIIFYHIPVNVKTAPSSPNTTRTGNGEPSLTNGSCSPYPTPGGVCQTELEDILFAMNCASEDIPLVLRDEESTFGRILFGLEFLDPSPECREAVVPFLCQFQFGLCDSSGVSLQPTSGRCEDLRDRVCRTEWSAALAFGIDLPDCTILPSEQALASCSFNENLTVFESNTSTRTLFPCREDFIRLGGSASCVPSCYTWHEYSATEVLVSDVFIGMATVLGFISGLAVITISIIRSKRMFSFPSIFIICMTFDIEAADFLIIITYFDRPSLYCASPSLIESLTHVTPFCVITGITFMYALLQIALWWLFHVSALFWKVVFPFHARSYEKSHKIKYVYAACIVSGVTIPLVSIIASMADFAVRVKSDPLLQDATFLSGGLGYGTIRFPPILCTATNSDIVYYGVVLPVNIILMAGLAELIIIFWRIHKQHGLFGAKKKTTKFIPMGTPERKILITLCYYVVMATFALTSFTIATRNSSPFVTQLLGHFQCEQFGQDPENPVVCDRNDFRQLVYPEVTAIAFALLGLFPVVHLVYAVNVKELKEKCKVCGLVKAKLSIGSGRSTGNTNSSAV